IPQRFKAGLRFKIQGMFVIVGELQPIYMAQDTKHLANDGFEIYWMKRFVERDNEQPSVWSMMVAGYFLLANVMGDSTYYDVTRESATERRTIWQAFLGGDHSPMQHYIQNREMNEKMVDLTFKVDIDDPLFGL
ncbi:MAG: hypothetical protein ABI970_24755, partial [Chloroflexota bacterium]